VRRQAATALGQIGDLAAIGPLLEASVDREDRFVEHSIIHALTLLSTPAPLLKALNHSSANVRRTAAIALDQMDGQPLEKQHIAPFLQSQEAELRRTGIWLASHHPEWSDVITGFLKDHLNGDELLDGDTRDLESLLITFSGDKNVQDFIAAELNDPGASLPKKLFLMKIMGLSTVAELPEIWVNPLRMLLRGGENEVQTAVLDLIESRNIPALEGELARIINDSGASAEIRLKALSSRIMSEPSLSDAEYRLVIDFLDPKFDSPIRQLAVRLLSRAELGDKQLLEVAQNQVATADLFLLPSLVDAFQSNSNPEV